MLRIEKDNKCESWPFVKRTREEFLDKRAADSK